MWNVEPAYRVAGVARAEHAVCIRADQTHAVLTRDRDSLFFQLATFFARFTEASGEKQRTFYAFFAALSHDVRSAARRRADEGEIDLVGRILQPRVAVDIEYLLFPGIDGDDRALVAVREQRRNRAVAALLRVVGRTDDGECARIEN